MSKIEMGDITENYEANMITKGFDISFEIVEKDSGVTNTYDSINDFAEQALMLINPMGFYTMKRIARELLAEVAKIEGEDAAYKFCREGIGMSEEEIEFIS